MSLSLIDLECFVEAARLLSFRAAAHRVALSPAAFGQHIKQLEDSLERRLFQRTTRKVVLTEAGLDLLPYARQVLSAVDDCRRAGRRGAEPAPLELVLGTRHELGLSWIVPMLDRLEATRPGLTLHLYFGSGSDLVSRVRRAEIDCAVSSTRLSDPMLDGEALHEERYALVGATRLLERTPFKSPSDAERHTLFDTTEELPLFRYLRDAPGAVDSQTFRRVVRLGTIEAIRALVLREKGVAVLPVYFIARELKSRRLKRILPKVAPRSDHFRLIYHRDDPRLSVYQAMAKVMRARALR